VNAASVRRAAIFDGRAGAQTPYHVTSATLLLARSITADTVDAEVALALLGLSTSFAVVDLLHAHARCTVIPRAADAVGAIARALGWPTDVGRARLGLDGRANARPVTPGRQSPGVGAGIAAYVPALE
jgi:hypothetical protein